MNLTMSGNLAAIYKSRSQRARVVTESWGEHNLYCPNCTSPKLDRLSHNTQASDFSCPKCGSWFQLKGQKSRLGNSITDGASCNPVECGKRGNVASLRVHDVRHPPRRTRARARYYFMHYEIVPGHPDVGAASPSL